MPGPIEEFLSAVERDLHAGAYPDSTDDVISELRAHLEDSRRALMELGLAPEEAERNAVAMFGKERVLAKELVQVKFPYPWARPLAYAALAGAVVAQFLVFPLNSRLVSPFDMPTTTLLFVIGFVLVLAAMFTAAFCGGLPRPKRIGQFMGAAFLGCSLLFSLTSVPQPSYGPFWSIAVPTPISQEFKEAEERIRRASQQIVIANDALARAAKNENPVLTGWLKQTNEVRTVSIIDPAERSDAWRRSVAEIVAPAIADSTAFRTGGAARLEQASQPFWTRLPDMLLPAAASTLIIGVYMAVAAVVGLAARRIVLWVQRAVSRRNGRPSAPA